MEENMTDFRATTICVVRRGDQVCIAGDGQVTMGESVIMKAGAKKVQKIYHNSVLVGFAGLLLNVPLIPGLGIVSASWLPGFNAMMFSWAIWPIYIGLILAIITTIHYCRWGLKEIEKAKQAAALESAEG